MGTRGRPRANIDIVQFENLCKLQCTLEEIASWFNVSEDTIERFCKREYGEGFRAVYKQKREGGKISLRRTQFKLAERSPAMAIFLGKQYLGQRDVQAVEVSKTTENNIKEIEEYLNGRANKSGNS